MDHQPQVPSGAQSIPFVPNGTFPIARLAPSAEALGHFLPRRGGERRLCHAFRSAEQCSALRLLTKLHYDLRLWSATFSVWQGGWFKSWSCGTKGNHLQNHRRRWPGIRPGNVGGIKGLDPRRPRGRTHARLAKRAGDLSAGGGASRTSNRTRSVSPARRRR